MTYEEFCKRIEEELSAGDPVKFVVSNATLSSLLSKETKITVIDSTIYFGIESEEKLYELMATDDPTAFDGIVQIMRIDMPTIPTNWTIMDYESKYSHKKHFSLALETNTLLRTVTL